MNSELIKAFVALLASVIFALWPLYPGRVRAPWANALLPVVGIIGMVLSSVQLLANEGWLATPASFDRMRPLLCGFALGLIAALILARQLLGQKRQENAAAAS